MMAPWILIIASAGTWGLTAVPNYPTKEACEYSAKYLQETNDSQRNMYFFRCIPGPEVRK